MAFPSQKAHHVIIMWSCVIPYTNKEVNQLILVSSAQLKERGFQPTSNFGNTLQTKLKQFM